MQGGRMERGAASRGAFPNVRPPDLVTHLPGARLLQPHWAPAMSPRTPPFGPLSGGEGSRDQSPAIPRPELMPLAPPTALFLSF